MAAAGSTAPSRCAAAPALSHFQPGDAAASGPWEWKPEGCLQLLGSFMASASLNVEMLPAPSCSGPVPPSSCSYEPIKVEYPKRGCSQEEMQSRCSLCFAPLGSAPAPWEVSSRGGPWVRLRSSSTRLLDPSCSCFRGSFFGLRQNCAFVCAVTSLCTKLERVQQLRAILTSTRPRAESHEILRQQLEDLREGEV